MDLLDIIHRIPVPVPWSEGEKIPWDDPAFSRRMLVEHLSEAHDHASRRPETIDVHVDWIHRELLAGRQARVLDLGCGPGLYTQRLAERGHECVGIDFGPASIEYAITSALNAGLRVAYRMGDIRHVDYGRGYDLIMLIFGELNVFRAADARSILTKSRQALVDGGRLLLEVHTIEAIRQIGIATPSWHTAEHGLFSERPHLRLMESVWDADKRIATERYYIIDAETANVTRYAQSMQAYTDDAYSSMLTDSGFIPCGVYPSLSGVIIDDDFFVLVAEAN